MGRFAALVAKLKAKGESESEATGVAAIAGRKKYGKKRFAAMGVAGRRNHDVSMSALDMLNAELALSGSALELGEENQHKKFKSEPFKTFRRRALKTAAVITGGPASPFSYSAHSAANHLEGEQNHKALRRTLKVGSFLSGGPLSYLLQRQAYKKHLQPVEASLELGALDIGAGLAGHAFRIAKSTYGKVANGFRKAAPVAKAYFNRATSQGRQAFQNAATGGRGPVIQRAMDATKAKQAARAAANAVPADQRPGINATRDFVGKSWAPHIKKAFGSVKGKVAGIATLGAGAAIGAAAMGTRPQNPLQTESQRRKQLAMSLQLGEAGDKAYGIPKVETFQQRSKRLKLKTSTPGSRANAIANKGLEKLPSLEPEEDNSRPEHLPHWKEIGEPTLEISPKLRAIGSPGLRRKSREGGIDA